MRKGDRSPPLESPRRGMQRRNHRPNITVLENRVSRLASSPHDNIDHRSGQVVGPNHLVREERPKHGVDRAHKPVAEIRFLPWLNGVDVRRSEDVNAGETCRNKRLFGLTLVLSVWNATSPRRVGATPT